MKKILFTLVISVISSLGIAQKIVIPDTAFASYLCSNYPNLVNAGCDSLLEGPAQGFEGFMDLSGTQIVDGKFISNFNRIDSLDMSNNPQMILMDSIQAEVFWSLDYVNFSNNELDSVPFFSINPNYVIVSEIILKNNNLTEFNKFWSGRDSVRILDLSENYISEVEDWSGVAGLVSMDFSNNYLTFEDLLPQTVHPNFESIFVFAPQRKIRWQESTIVGEENKSITLDLNVDEGVDGSTFTWFRDGEEVGQTSNSKLVLDQLTLNHAGTYTVKITNDNLLLASLELESEGLDLEIVPCMDTTNFSYNLVQQCYGAEFSVDPLSISGGVAPYSFVLSDSQNVQTILSDGENQVLAGMYKLEARDLAGCVKELEQALNVEALEDCDKLVITPNGDNQQDEYYFSQIGQAQVFNKNGAQVAEFNLPGFWDARSANGEVVSPGKYVMVIDNQEKVELIIMW